MKDQRPGSRADTARPLAEQSEAALVGLAQQGDKQAVGELYVRHVDVIYRYVIARVRDECVAEDITGHVFLKAIEDLPRYRVTKAPFLAWLYRIACARTSDYWRQQYRHPEVPLGDVLPATDCESDTDLDARQRSRLALDLLADLSDDQQDVLILRFIGEMSLADTAVTLGKTPGAVKALQHRALASIARLIKERTN